MPLSGVLADFFVAVFLSKFVVSARVVTADSIKDCLYTESA